MINSLPPSVIPTTNRVITPNDQPLAERGSEKATLAPIGKAATGKAHEARSADHDHGRTRESEGSAFFQTAKNMIKDAFKDFRQDLRESLRDIGFKGEIANEISKSVMQAAQNALRSGADFSAKLMVAAISQTTSISAAGTNSSFSMVASSIEVNINHTTGSIDVSTMKVSIEGQTNEGLGGNQPRLLDMKDSDRVRAPDLTGAMLALQDIDAIFGNEEETDVEQPIAQPGVIPTAREAVGSQLEETIDTSTTRTAIDTVLQKAATDDDVNNVDDDDIEAVEKSSDDVKEEADETDLAMPEIATPLLNGPQYSARIFITAYERFINDREERITFMRFDAIVPLSSKSITPADETPALLPVTEEPSIAPAEDPTLMTEA